MPMGDEGMPPMGMDGEGMNPEMDMNDNMDDGNNLPSDFDSNFDAGVEADEETDPKKYIQQLTGKLSQSLNSYNNENGEPDTELGKYVLGMLVKQGTKGMDDKDRKEIIKKINSNDSDLEDMPEEDVESNDDSMDNETSEMNEMPMESKTFRFTKQQLLENFGITMDNDKKVTKMDTKISSDTIRNNRTRPFEAPKKFKE